MDLNTENNELSILQKEFQQIGDSIAAKELEQVHDKTTSLKRILRLTFGAIASKPNGSV